MSQGFTRDNCDLTSNNLSASAIAADGAGELPSASSCSTPARCSDASGEILLFKQLLEARDGGELLREAFSFDPSQLSSQTSHSVELTATNLLSQESSLPASQTRHLPVTIPENRVPHRTSCLGAALLSYQRCCAGFPQHPHSHTCSDSTTFLSNQRSSRPRIDCQTLVPACSAPS